jgi:hypothetical protein
MIVLCLTTGILLLVWVATVTFAAHLFFKREKEWQKREAEYINRLLVQGHVAPLPIEREKVIKVADPDTPVLAETWVDAAFREDDIREDIEQLYPEAAHMTLDAIKRDYAADWKRFEKRALEQRTPLRAG